MLIKKVKIFQNFGRVFFLLSQFVVSEDLPVSLNPKYSEIVPLQNPIEKH